MYKNTDQTMEVVRRFEDRSAKLGHNPMGKGRTKFGRELGLQLNLVYPSPTCCTEEGEEILDTKVKRCLKLAQQEQLKKKVECQAW